MEGQKQLSKTKLRVAFNTDLDPVVDWVNTPWTVKCTPEELVETATVKYGENGIQIIITFNSIQAYLCDDFGGPPKLFTIIGSESSAIE